jgi:hypothetical protein
VPRLVFLDRNGVAVSIVEIDFAPVFAGRHLLAELQSFFFAFKSLVARFANLNSPAIKSDWDNMYFAVHHGDKRLPDRIRVPNGSCPAMPPRAVLLTEPHDSAPVGLIRRSPQARP